MNNKIHIVHPTKAGFYACFFLLSCLAVKTTAQTWAFDANTQAAYQLVLNLQTAEAHQLISQPQTAQEYYVISLAEALELIITEDKEKFEEYYQSYEKRIDKRSKSSLAEDLFLQAEMRLQWAFVYLKFGHEFDAATNLRQAYVHVEECKRRFPKFQAIKKTSGVLEVLVGTVPEKYNWILSLLKMEGSVQKGLDHLKEMGQLNTVFHFEATLLYSLLQGFVLQQTNEAVESIKKLQDLHSSNKLLYFLGAALAIKNSQSEYALTLINAMEEIDKGLPLPYANYLKGEIYLHKAAYFNALSSYRWFINNYNGQNYIKDAYYKMGICYWLNGNVNDAHAIFKEAKTMGRESVEADKYAARSLSETELPNIKLTKIRYACDGGFYEEAGQLLSLIVPSDIPTTRDQIEFYYRKARLAHKTNQWAAAKLFYGQVIDMTKDESWYFAPNASLQMGYIFFKEGETDEAKKYFERAITYKKHPYKNSIDSKAKSALAQLKSRR